MLARCPQCDQRFPVVGNCITACPFCSARVQVELQRAVGAPQAATQTRGERAERAGHDFDSMAETLARGTLADKISIPPALDTGAGPPPAPPPRLGPPRASWLFLQPGEFFARLERGRPRLRPGAGAALLLVGGAVQGASFAPYLPGAPARLVGAGLGAVVAFAGLLYLLSAYRLAARFAGVGVDLAPRVWPVLGYGFVPMALALVPLGGLPAAVGTAAAAHTRGLEHHLGLSAGTAQAVVLASWTSFGALAVIAARGWGL